jgi:hypothetical protein
MAGGRSSPELSLATAPGHGDLTRRHGRQDGDVGTKVAGLPRAEGRRGGLEAVRSEARLWNSVCEAHGERR